MKKNILLLGIILVALMSCTTMKKSIPTAPLSTQINLTLADLDYIGEVSGTASQSYVLGLPYGGRKYKTGVTPSLFSIHLPINRIMNNAMYDALMTKPDADFILPITYETTATYSFLGRKETLKLKAKAFKIKVK
jgi:hypothetical protein